MLIAKLFIQQTLGDAKIKGKDTVKEPQMVALSLKEKYLLTFHNDFYTIKLSKITKHSVIISATHLQKERQNSQLVQKLFASSLTLRKNDSLRLTIGYFPTISLWRIQLLEVYETTEPMN